MPLTDQDYQDALLSKGPGDEPKPLSPVQKEHWNKFIDFIQKSGYKGSADLDNRDKKIGQDLMNKFNASFPESQISYNDVPAVQTELQNYRNNLVKQWKAGKATSDDVKTEDDIMPGISQVDGWLGSKTSSYKFPTATLVDKNTGIKKDFGVNVDKYDNLVKTYNSIK